MEKNKKLHASSDGLYYTVGGVFLLFLFGFVFKLELEILL